MRFFFCVKGGEIFERGRSPLSLLLPSPAMEIPHFFTRVQAGEGFILKVHPEGLGVRSK